jgi:hypothetical protein
VIDPVFTYLTYLGGSGAGPNRGLPGVNQTTSPAQALAIDSAGDVYVTGETMSADFPVANAYQATSKTKRLDGLCECTEPIRHRVSVLHLSGRVRLHLGNSVVWDSHDIGVRYVVGTTNSPDFPITAGAFQTIFRRRGAFQKVVLRPITTPSWPSSAPPVNSRTRPFWVGTTITYWIRCSNGLAGPRLRRGFTELQLHPTRLGLLRASQLHRGRSFPRAPFRRMATALYPFSTRTLSTLLYSTLLGDPNGAGGSTLRRPLV